MNDYDLTEVQKIDLNAFKMYIPKRYIPHYLINDYEQFSSKIIQSSLKPGNTFVDIGTHLGYYCLLAGTANKDIKVIGIEPAEANFNITKKNVELNKLKNIELYNLAASNKDGIRRFLLNEAAGESGFYDPKRSPIIDEVNVRTVMMDNLIKNKKIDFIKIDVEGHEIEVLQGLEKTLKSDIRLLIEYNPLTLKSANTSGEALLKTIISFGFKIYFIDEEKEKLVLYDTNNDDWKYLAKLPYTNILCIKEDELNHTIYKRSAKKSKLYRKNKHNLTAQRDYYKNLLTQSQSNIDLEVELSRIKNSKLWKLLYIYKNPKEAFKKFIINILEKKANHVKVNQDRLHLGCGFVILPDWLNVDIDDNENKDIYKLDLSKPFPFFDCQTSLIFAEHIIECFSKKDGLNFIKECYRILIPGGAIRIGFSDFSKLLSAYNKKDMNYRQKMQTDMQPLIFKIWDEFISDMLFSWDRRYYYTSKLLISFLKEAGFVKIKIKKINESDYEFENDSRKLPDNTYLEAQKPNN